LVSLSQSLKFMKDYTLILVTPISLGEIAFIPISSQTESLHLLALANLML
jgi:hypothetical protein